jgi:hypothetical protein
MFSVFAGITDSTPILSLEPLQLLMHREQMTIAIAEDEMYMA